MNSVKNSIEASSRETFVYKDCIVSRQLKGLINHMDVVEECRVEIQALGQQWDLLTILGMMSGENMDMSATREGFRRLTSELLDNLAREILNKTVQHIVAKAQVAVDIVIRNLFERTADIGFLATDDDIRECLNGNKQDKSALQARFREYVAKYSVYDNIMLLDAQGQVQVQMDDAHPVEYSRDPILRAAMQTKAAFVEAYRHTDLMPHRDKTLVYAYRVTASNRPDSEVLGVLCLCFRFENEMDGVFAELTGGSTREVILLTDHEGRVLASSDHYHIPPGAALPLIVDRRYGVCWFSGRPYLTKTCATRGYQGYMGLGWHGHVMVPLEQAFVDDEGSEKQVDSLVLLAVMNNPRLFSEALRRIPREASSIQQELDRTVWNGNIRHDGNRGGASGVLLWEIGRTGRRTQTVFENSIGRLHQTVVSASLYDASFVASLAINIMDRNLYERANDCRWWALTGRFRTLLGNGFITDEARDELNGILKYINDLYTVYSNLLLFDVKGVVVATSTASSRPWIGKPLDAGWVKDVLSLNRSEQYAVSDFDSSDLYGGRHTFIYGAAVVGNAGRTVGGIAIVFDSEPQFAAMLDDALPRDGDGMPVDGAVGLFVDASGLVIASAGGRYQVGQHLALPGYLCNPEPGRAYAGVYELDGVYYAAGARKGDGYREYKGPGDRYQYGISAIVLIPLGVVARDSQSLVNRVAAEKIAALRQSADGTKVSDIPLFATFFAGAHWLALPVEAVCEAVSINHVSRIPGVHAGVSGCTFYKAQSIPVIDLNYMTSGASSACDPLIMVVGMINATTRVGLMVDRLGPVIPGCRSGDGFEPVGAFQKRGMIKGVIHAVGAAESPMAVVLDLDAVFNSVGGAQLAGVLAEHIAALS
ncbi:MAG TPA: chemotaxis protein CheW [Verrucomicrobia bacterium]|nr:chemotaxis protein CheW [Verrucomicrobiota bacterium]